MEEIVYFVWYRQYGNWSSTVGFRADGFENRTDMQALRKARNHIKLYLARPDKDYIKDVSLVEIKMVGGRPAEMIVLEIEG